jgi:hypothetical protein
MLNPSWGMLVNEATSEIGGGNLSSQKNQLKNKKLCWEVQMSNIKH